MDAQVIKDQTGLSISRIGALYKHFDSYRELNPEGFEANIDSWKLVLLKLLENDHFDQLSLPPDAKLIEQLTLKTIGKPLSLSTVLSELVDIKYMVPLSIYIGFELNFNNYLHPNINFIQYLSPTLWINHVNLVAKNVLKLLSGSSERYVIWDHLVKFSKVVINKLDKNDGLYSSKLYNKKHLLYVIGKITPNFTDLDLEILLKYFSRDSKDIQVDYVDDDIIIKVDKHQQVTMEDVGIAQLRWNIEEILQQLDTINGRIDSTNNELTLFAANQLKQESVKVKVLSLLKIRKLQESSYSKLSSSYDNLFEILLRMDDATSNLKVFKALKESSIILNQLNSAVNVDEIEDVKDQLKYHIDQGNVITESLGDNMMDSNVEQDYNELVQSMNDEEEPNLIEKLKNLNVDDKPMVAEHNNDVKQGKEERETLYN